MLKLQRVNHVVQREVELALLLERLDDRQVVHTAILDADDLIADAVAQQVDGEVAGLEGEPAVVGGRRAATLGVAEHGRARLALALVFEQQGELFGADRVVLVDALRAVLDEVAAPVGGLHGVPRAFGDDDGCARVAHVDQAGEAVGGLLNRPRHLRHEADFRAGTGGGLQGDIAAVTAHDLHHARTVVGTAGCADGADIVDAGVDGGVIAQRHLGIGEVVVNRAGDAHAGDAQFAQPHRAVIGTVTADDDDALDAHLADVVGRVHAHFRSYEIKATRGAQVGARLIGDIQNGIQIQLDHVILNMVASAERAVIAALDADEGHAVIARGFGDRHDGGVHARGISAGSQNTDTTHKEYASFINWMKNARMRGNQRGIAGRNACGKTPIWLYYTLMGGEKSSAAEKV